jgi:O-antigen/teichoic acid export membrane protein
MALAGIWTAMIILIVEMGLGAAIVQFRDLNERELNACFWSTMAVAVGGYLGLFIAAPWIAHWFETQALTGVLRVVGLTLPLGAVRIVPESLLRKELALDKISKAEIASVVVSIPITLVMAWAGFGVWALVASVLVMQAVRSAVTFWFIPWHPGFSIGSARLFELMHFSGSILGTRLCVALYQQADVFVLGKLSGEAVVGIFSMAKQLALLPAEKISFMINEVATPVMAELQDNRAAMRAAFLRGMRLVACITVPLSLGILLVAEDFVWVTLTEKWSSAVPLLQILCIYALLRSGDVLLSPVLRARYRVTFLLRYGIALVLIMPLAFWAGAVYLGATGVALVWVCVYPLIMFWMASTTLYELDLAWHTLWMQVRLPLGASLVMAAVVLTIQYLMPGVTLGERVARLLCASGGGAIAYCGSIFWHGGLIVDELLEMSGWFFRNRQQTAVGK